MPTQDNIISGKFKSGNREYDLREIWYSPDGVTKTQVWPSVFRYEIISVRILYSDATTYQGVTCLRADGVGYAYANGTVRKYRGDTVISTTTELLTPVTIVNQVVDTINGVRMDRFHIEGNTVTGNDWKTTPNPDGVGTDVVFSYQGLATATGFVAQSGNVPVADGYVDEAVLGYRIELSNTDFTSAGGETTVSGVLTRTRTQRYRWTTRYFSYDAPEVYETAGLSNISVSPNAGVQISGNTIRFPQNLGTDEVVYAVTGTYSGNSATEYVYVYGSDTGRTYGRPTITAYSYPSTGSGSSAYHIGAAGGGVYPRVAVSIPCTVGGTTYTLTGETTTGETVVAVADRNNTVTATVNIAYYGNSVNGYVSAPSRGTNIDSGRTTVASGLYVIVSKGANSSTSSSLTVYQQRNQVTVPGSFNVQQMTVVPMVDNADLPQESGTFRLPAPRQDAESVYVKVIVTGSGTTSVYTSGEGGNTISLDNEPVTPTSVSVTPSGTPLSNQTFTADNRHSTSDKTYSVTATYEGTQRTASVFQPRDSKVDGAQTAHVSLALVQNSNTLWAGGGTVGIVGTAYSTAGKVWQSDGTAVAGESSETDNTGILTLTATASSNDAYTIVPVATDTASHTKTFLVTHRDMKSSVTTDTLSVVAVNGQVSSSPLSFSIVNAVDTSQNFTEYGPVVYGEEYPLTRNYNVSFAINSYKSDTAPAPFYGNPVTGYNVSGYHQTANFHDGVQAVYTYQHYLSWSAEHDDDDHKYIVGEPTYDDQTHRGEQVTDWSTVWGDPCSVTTGASWLTIDTTNKTITFDTQTDPTSRQRSFAVIATNTADTATPKASASIVVYQQAYQSLTANPNQHDWDWDVTQSIDIAVTARYVQFKVQVLGEWVSAQISFNYGMTFEAVNPDTLYGSVTQATSAFLRVGPRSRNDPTFNPTGYRDPRIGQVKLLPQDTGGVSSVMIRLSQAKYDGGLDQ